MSQDSSSLAHVLKVVHLTETRVFLISKSQTGEILRRFFYTYVEEEKKRTKMMAFDRLKLTY
jgi:hypothetical protein